MQYLGDNIHEGDVILSNHPAAGGSHLPDLTVITPVSYNILSANMDITDLGPYQSRLRN